MQLERALDHGAAVWILGDLRYATPAGPADAAALRGRQPRLLLAHLAATPHRAVDAESLAATLWADHRPDGWTATLRSVVSRLRGALVRAGWPSRQPVRATLGGYALDVDGPLWVDAAFARRAASLAEAALAVGDHGRAATSGESAWQLARRPPALLTTTHFGRRLASVMHETAYRGALSAGQAWLGGGDPAFAVHFARCCVEFAPHREAGWRLLLEAHHRGADLAAVAAVFDEMLSRFEGDLGVSPHPATFALYRRLVDASSGARPQPVAAGGRWG